MRPRIASLASLRHVVVVNSHYIWCYDIAEAVEVASWLRHIASNTVMVQFRPVAHRFIVVRTGWIGGRSRLLHRGRACWYQLQELRRFNAWSRRYRFHGLPGGRILEAARAATGPANPICVSISSDDRRRGIHREDAQSAKKMREPADNPLTMRLMPSLIRATLQFAWRSPLARQPARSLPSSHSLRLPFAFLASSR
jgi:hypothetical protein